MSPQRKRKCLALLSGSPHGCVSGLRAVGLRVVGLEDVTTPISDGKRLKRSSLDEEA